MLVDSLLCMGWRFRKGAEQISDLVIIKIDTLGSWLELVPFCVCEFIAKILLLFCLAVKQVSVVSSSKTSHGLSFAPYIACVCFAIVLLKISTRFPSPLLCVALFSLGRAMIKHSVAFVFSYVILRRWLSRKPLK